MYSGRKSAHETRGKKRDRAKALEAVAFNVFRFVLAFWERVREGGGGKDSSLSFGPSVAYALPR